MVLMHLQFEVLMQSTHNGTKLEMLTKTMPENQRLADQPAGTAGGPDRKSELGVGDAHRNRQRLTSNESELPRDRGLMVTLWVLASLIAEVEVLWWILGRIYAS